MDNPTLPEARTRSPDWLFWLSLVLSLSRYTQAVKVAE